MLHRLPCLSLALFAFVSLGGAEGEDSGIRLELAPVEIPLRDGGFVSAERGMLRVPIVRADPSSKEIAIDVWRFHSVEGAAPDAPPVFRLYGGPGWPGMELADIAYEGDLLPMLRVADLVIVGQRGIGTSTDTACAGLEEEGFEELPREEQARLLQSACGACRAHWEAQGYDLSGFNVIEAAGDVDDVRRLLGYDKITLWGASYGSHWAMAVMRYHPDSVARAVLTGMEGPDHTYDMPSGILAALERIAFEAEISNELLDDIPDEGLIEALRGVIARAEAEPIVVEVPHPTTGEPTEVRFEASDVRDLARGYTQNAGVSAGSRVLGRGCDRAPPR